MRPQRYTLSLSMDPLTRVLFTLSIMEVPSLLDIFFLYVNIICRTKIILIVNVLFILQFFKKSIRLVFNTVLM